MSKLHKQAKELLHAANKVYHYRRDVIAEARLQELEKAVEEVNGMYRDKAADPVPFEAAIDRLDALLRKIGGKIHPKTFLSDNLEVALVAAILVIGVRTFFFQPFIIPTNSMYPTYNGMNAVVYDDADPSPVPAKMLFNKLTRGATHYRVAAPKDGTVRVPVFSQSRNSADAQLRGMGLARFEIVKGRKWFGILPTKKRQYTFYVDDQPVKVTVPLDFRLDDVICQAFFPSEPSLGDAAVSEHEGHIINVFSANPVLVSKKEVQAGQDVLEFDITLGDALFVDRFTYHFRRPKAGDPFVFRTRDIPGIEGHAGEVVDKYYIKRLGGVGGETLEIKDGVLYADGKPRDEAEAFERNARREGEYNGYVNHNLLGEGRQLVIPEDKFIALGDNSGNSQDSRYWGFVPEKAVIGKAMFIYYPFTKHWGLAE